jgi:uncharacterized protein YjcR
LFKLSELPKREVFEMKNVKHKERSKAIKWFLAGTKEETICSKLEISKNTFRLWVGNCEDFRQFRKNTAFAMSKAKVPEGEICRQLGIDKNILKKWVKEGYEKELKTAVIPNRSGKLAWVDDICKTFMN